MKQMSIRKQIRIQRIQNKNRMTGKTFNPTGITSEQLRDREIKLRNEWEKLSKVEIQELYDRDFKNLHEFYNKVRCSYSFELCCLLRFTNLKTI